MVTLQHSSAFPVGPFQLALRKAPRRFPDPPTFTPGALRGTSEQSNSTWRTLSLGFAQWGSTKLTAAKHQNLPTFGGVPSAAFRVVDAFFRHLKSVESRNPVQSPANQSPVSSTLETSPVGRTSLRSLRSLVCPSCGAVLLVGVASRAWPPGLQVHLLNHRQDWPISFIARRPDPSTPSRPDRSDHTDSVGAAVWSSFRGCLVIH